MQQQYIILALALVASLGLVLSAPLEEDVTDNELEDLTMTNAALIPNEDDNLVGLVEPQTMFTPFCKQARDLIVGKIENEKNNLKALVFNVIMNSGEKLVDEVSKTSTAAINQLGDTLRDPSKPVESRDETDAVQSTIDEAAKKIQDGTNKSDVLSSITTVLSVVLTKAKQVLTEQLAKAKLMVNPDSMLLINDGCDRLKTEYLDVAQAMFKTHHQTLTQVAKEEKNTNAVNFLTYFNKMEQLNCGITKRLLKLKLFCAIYAPTAPVVQQMLANSK